MQMPGKKGDSKNGINYLNPVFSSGLVIRCPNLNFHTGLTAFII